MRDADSPLDPELTALERQLTALAPLAELDRDALMYAAGMTAGRRRLRGAAALLGVAGASCGAVLALLVLGWQPPGAVAPPGGMAAGVVQVGGQGADDAPSGESPAAAKSAAAPASGPTYYRLLRQWAANRDAEIASRQNPPVPIEPDGDPVRPEPARTLLKRYLDAAASL